MSLHRHLELEPERVHHLQHGGEFRIPFRRQRLVEALPPETGPWRSALCPWRGRSRRARETREFRDFVLGRLSKPKVGERAGAAPRDDIAWHSFVALVIAPH